MHQMEKNDAAKNQGNKKEEMSTREYLLSLEKPGGCRGLLSNNKYLKESMEEREIRYGTHNDPDFTVQKPRKSIKKS